MKNKRIKNLKIRSTALALATTFVLAGTFSGCSKKNNENNAEMYQNKIGYSNVGISTKENEFVILDVGNYLNQKPLFRDKKIKYCNNNDISLGIIISTEAQDLADIYNDIEYARTLVNDNAIDFPIYLDLTGIINNEKLNVEMKRKMISNFLNKCSANKMHVAIYGNDDILCIAKKYFDDIISDYDAFVVSDNKDIKYTGNYNLYKINNDNIVAKKDLSKITEKKSLNKKEGLVNDGKYTISSDDSLLEIAMDSGLSISELLKYNNLREKDITPGISIKIPSKINTKQSKNIKKYVFEKNDKMVRGCDISCFQTDINWDKLSKNFDFVLIRTNHGTSLDKACNTNIKNANKKGISVGTYCFNDYNARNCYNNFDVFKEAIKQQTNKAIDALENHNIEYPVYLDIERVSKSDNNITWDKLLPDNYAVYMINSWYKKVASAGYIPGVYFSRDCYLHFENIYNKMKNKEDMNAREFIKIWDSIQKWLAGGEQYGTEKIDIKDVKAPSNNRKDKYPNVNVFQVTSTASNAGASNKSGNLDINYSDIDYTNSKEVIEKVNKEKIVFKDIKDKTNDKIIYGALFQFVTIPSIAYYVIAKKRKKEKEQERRRQQLMMQRRKRASRENNRVR